MEILKDLPIGLKYRGFMVRETVRLAESLDSFLCFSQLVPGHVQKQMVLNLVIEPAVPEVSKGIRFHISGSEYLPMKKIKPTIFIQHKHALVVRGKNRTDVKAKQHLMDHDEQNSLPGTQEKEHYT